MSRSCIVTVWERKNEKGEWEHNHIASGFEEGKHPKIKHPSYDSQKGWEKGEWRRSFMYITDDDKLEPIPDGPPTAIYLEKTKR